MLTRTVRRWAEKLFGEWAEGPQPPKRLDDLATVFVAQHPRATRGEWLAFAREHGRMAYRAGWQRGYEHVERDEDIFAEKDPEGVADMLDPDWRWGQGIKLGEDPDEVVPDEWPPEVLEEDTLRRVAEVEAHEGRGGQRVVQRARRG